jgi:hypothetical protein
MEQTVAAASSPAEVQDTFNGENLTFEEFSRYRKDGTVPERFKPAETPEADPASAEPPESSEGEQPESASDSEPDIKQEPPKKGKSAEDRIAQLEATIEKIRKGAGLERKTEPAPVTQTEKPQPPQSFQEWKKTFNATEWIQNYGKENPRASYEDAVDAMTDYKADVRDQFREIEQQRAAQNKELNDKVTDARERYGDQFDEVVWPTLSTIVNNPRVNPTVKAMLNDSEQIADVLFTIGSDEKTLNQFLQMAEATPGKALRYIATIENGIIEESAKETVKRDEKGKFVAKEPEKPPAPTKTQAPKPPSPVSGSSSRGFDASDENSHLSNEEWQRQRNADRLKRFGRI